ncbi:MAG TPA: serine/threonine-protein kinase, partial [bacterium]|nr:serine/threonine-protein kinase [bacterium]
MVSIYKFGIVEDHPYIVYEFVQGTPLDQIQSPVPSEKLIKIGVDIASGLAAAHRNGVIHRDIKPANAIITADDTTKILDFGIAKVLSQKELLVADQEKGALSINTPSAIREDISEDIISVSTRRWDENQGGSVKIQEAGTSLTHPGGIVGTPQYMAPELFLGATANFQSDVYSFGALMYTLCTGVPPHKGKNLLDIISDIQNNEPCPIADLAPEVDSRIKQIIQKCLARDPKERFPSGSELRSAWSRLSLFVTELSHHQDVMNPFRGLDVFEADHQQLFFGRDSEIRMLLEKLKRDPFILIVGDSGVGKSSLCRAGVLPRVGSWLHEKNSWEIVRLVPGRNPIQALAKALVPVLHLSDIEIQKTIKDEAQGIGRFIRAHLPEQTGLVLFIDQLEELVTLG